MKCKIKRIYDAPSPGDGFRVLVDRVWPRGMKKADAAIDLWQKELAPSTELRKWFNHEPGKWQEFRKRYLGELKNNHELIEDTLSRAGNRPLTLLFSARDREHNQAVIIKEYLEQHCQ